MHGADRVFHGAIGGDHDNCLLRVEQANLRQHVHPALVGEREVEQNQVEGAYSKLRQTFPCVFRNHDGIAFELEKSLQRLPDFGFVVDDEDSARAGLRVFRRAPARRGHYFRDR